MSIHHVTLTDCLHPVAPPETILRIGAVGDTAFVYIEKYEEDAKGSRSEIIAQIPVSLPALREALQLIRHDVEREDLRPADGDQGDMAATLTGARFSVLPL